MKSAHCLSALPIAATDAGFQEAHPHRRAPAPQPLAYTGRRRRLWSRRCRRWPTAASPFARTGPCRGLILAVLLLAGGAAQGSPVDETLENLMETYWEAQVRAAPLSASLWGESRYRDRVDDLSPGALKAQATRLDEAMEALARIDAGQLSHANREHYEAFAWMLTHERRNLDFNSRYFTINSLGGWHSHPAAGQSGIGNGVPMASKSGH